MGVFYFQYKIRIRNQLNVFFKFKTVQPKL